MTKQTTITTTTIVALALSLFSASAKEYFVAPSGKPGNPGTKELPFALIQEGCDVAMPGDTVTLRAGLYYVDEQVRPMHSGTGSAWITYRAMPGEQAIIDGSKIRSVMRPERVRPPQESDKTNRKGSSAKKTSTPPLVPTLFSHLTEGVFQIEQSYIRVQGLTIRNSYAGGIIVRGGNNFSFWQGAANAVKQILLEDCKIDRSFNSGIGLWYADSVVVRRCEITRANDIDFHVEGTRLGREAPHEAMSICGTRFFEIYDNHLHDCYKEGIDCKEVTRHGVVHHNRLQRIDRQALYADAWFGLLEDIDFHHNVVSDGGWGFAISVEGKDSDLRNIRFHHNVIYNMKASGILFGMWGHNRLRSDIYIYNNTIYRCGSPSHWAGGVGSIDILSQNFQDVYIYRNICDKGWDYELGFTFAPNELPQALEDRRFVAEENLFECYKNRPSKLGQYDVLLTEYHPANNQLGTVVYRNEAAYDFTPESMPEIKAGGRTWKYAPSPWYGAIEPAAPTH